MYPHPAVIIYFYPRPLRGGRRAKAAIEDADEIFLSTPSARRATHELDHGQRAQVISIHALCEEGDVDRADVPEGVVISIHALCEEGDLGAEPHLNRFLDFYPRPLRGGRPQDFGYRNHTEVFLSTPSARRATTAPGGRRHWWSISIHALCEEGDVKKHRSQHCHNIISIHALCEEGDCQSTPASHRPSDFYPRPLRGGRRGNAKIMPQGKKFLSTPSARRATQRRRAARRARQISIHALCEEGDSSRSLVCSMLLSFLSTPSARRATLHRSARSGGQPISIHALCEEGDDSPKQRRLTP